MNITVRTTKTTTNKNSRRINRNNFGMEYSLIFTLENERNQRKSVNPNRGK